MVVSRSGSVLNTTFCPLLVAVDVGLSGVLLLKQTALATDLGIASRHFFLALVLTLVLRHADKPIQEHRRGNVEDDVRPHDPKVAPHILWVGGHAGQKGVRVGDLAEAAVARRVWVLEVATKTVDVRLHVFCTGLT